MGGGPSKGGAFSGCTKVLNRFGIRVLYHESDLHRERENAFCSPYSLAVALFVTGLLATRGSKCQRQFTDLLGGISAPDLAKFLSEMEVIFQEARTCKIYSAGGVWSSLTHIPKTILELLPPMTPTAQIGIFASKDLINDYIMKATMGVVNEVITGEPEGPMVIACGFVFQGRWEYRFDRTFTKPMEFATSDEGGRKSVAMMCTTFPAESVFFQENVPVGGATQRTFCDILALPYQRWEKDACPPFQAIIILPSKGVQTRAARSDLEKTLDAVVTDMWDEESDISCMLYRDMASRFNKSGGYMNPDVLEVHLPRFKVSCNGTYSKSLQEMGMKDAFDPDAVGNFASIFPRRDPFHLEEVYHKAICSVDEDGLRQTRVGKDGNDLSMAFHRQELLAKGYDKIAWGPGTPLRRGGPGTPEDAGGGWGTAGYKTSQHRPVPSRRDPTSWAPPRGAPKEHAGTGRRGDPVHGSRTTFRVDRPFLFAIQNLETKVLIFVGKMVNPEGWQQSACTGP